MPDSIRADQWGSLRAMLDEAEQAQADRFHFAEDRDAYVAAHALLRGLLAPRLNCMPNEIQFLRGANGKPELDTPEPVLRFNLSHTRGMVAVALARQCDVGIDVERVDPTRLGLDTAHQFFAPAEVRQLYALAPEYRCGASFAFWTLKEAYIKAVGLGLSVPLDCFAFILKPLSITFTPSITDNASCWRFDCMSVASEFRLAIAARRKEVQFDVRKVDATALLALRL
jgi:4'-phosphopantetheinyl transferase